MSTPAVRIRPGERRCLVDVRMPAVPATVPVLRNLVGALAVAAGAGEHPRADIALCVTEAVTNVVLHGYPGGEPGEVRLTADASGDTFEVVVGDDGVGLRAHPGREGGLGQGLSIIARCAAAFGVDQPHGGGVAVWMRFHLPPEAA